MKRCKIYLIGSLKNRAIIDIAQTLRAKGFDAFDEWISPGPEADEYWQSYESQRDRGYKEALASHHAQHIFEFDKKHLEEADAVVMVLPCGKSGHLEFGWAVGQGKPAYILFDGEPERYDLMYAFATDIFFSPEELLGAL